MNIVILDADTLTIHNDIDFSVFEQFGNVTVYPFTRDEQIVERIKNMDVVLCNKSLMSGEKLCQAPRVKYIGLFATGYNNIDLEYTRAHGITVCNAGSYSTEAVAQHVFALILHNYNTVAKYDDFVKSGGWIRTDKFSPFMEMKELYGKTIGIIGYGSIGRKVGEIAKAFGMNVLAYSRSMEKKALHSACGVQVTEKSVPESDRDMIADEKSAAEPDEDMIAVYASVDRILAESDIVTMHCPLNQSSKKMCNREFFQKMKKDALFINTSRGGVVDEEALAEALKNRMIGAAALDVVGKEPMSPDCCLLDAPNLVITPHAAWAPLETRTRLIKIVVKNLQKWVAGTPINVIK